MKGSVKPEEFLMRDTLCRGGIFLPGIKRQEEQTVLSGM